MQHHMLISLQNPFISHAWHSRLTLHSNFIRTHARFRHRVFEARWFSLGIRDIACYIHNVMIMACRMSNPRVCVACHLSMRMLIRNTNVVHESWFPLLNSYFMMVLMTCFNHCMIRLTSLLHCQVLFNRNVCLSTQSNPSGWNVHRFFLASTSVVSALLTTFVPGRERREAFFREFACDGTSNLRQRNEGHRWRSPLKSSCCWQQQRFRWSCFSRH